LFKGEGGALAFVHSGRQRTGQGISFKDTPLMRGKHREGMIGWNEKTGEKTNYWCSVREKFDQEKRGRGITTSQQETRETKRLNTWKMGKIR